MNNTKRNYDVFMDWESGLSAKALSKKYGIPIKQVNKIIKRESRKREERTETDAKESIIFGDVCEQLAKTFPQIKGTAIRLAVNAVAKQSVDDPEASVKGLFLTHHFNSFVRYIPRFVENGGLDTIKTDSRDAPMARTLLMDLCDKDRRVLYRK